MNQKELNCTRIHTNSFPTRLVGNGATAAALMLGPASSHRTILFESGVVLLAKEGEFHNGCLVSAINVSNLTIRGSGAVFQMRKSNYADPTKYNFSESRHALALYGCTDLSVIGLSIRSSGGERGGDHHFLYRKSLRMSANDGANKMTVPPSARRRRYLHDWYFATWKRRCEGIQQKYTDSGCHI